MAVSLSTVFILGLLASLQIVTTDSKVVDIEINPEKGIASLVEVVNILCSAESVDEFENELSLIELSRNDQAPIAFISGCGKANIRHNPSNKFKASGSIEKGTDQSYLNVSLVAPQTLDTGIYTCHLYYTPTSGPVKKHAVSANLLIEHLDASRLETVLSHLKERIASMEEKNTKLQEKVTALEKANQTHSKQISDVNFKVVYTSAFSATANEEFIPTMGERIVFPDIIMRVGSGYDENSGEYTAPVPGLYVFHVVIQSVNGCHFYLDLMSETSMISRLHTYDSQGWPQSSISSVVELEAGDVVYMMARSGFSTCKLDNQKQSVFTGYLLKVSPSFNGV